MFQFGFSNLSHDTKKSEEITDVSWVPCTEIFAKDIFPALPVPDISNILKFPFGHLMIQHLPCENAVRSAKQQGLTNIISAEEQHSDLLPGVYEGGLKVWECTRDLADYICVLNFDWNKSIVLDLGCGAGILGIYALLNGANVVFQDYNREVLQLLTIPNVSLNCDSESVESARFLSGDWESFQERLIAENSKKFDMILTSETIYNPNNYEKIHNVILNLLSPSGVCFLAAKSTYFGVGGSVFGFQEFVHSNGCLLAESCWSSLHGVRREILKVVHQPQQ